MFRSVQWLIIVIGSLFGFLLAESKQKTVNTLSSLPFSSAIFGLLNLINRANSIYLSLASLLLIIFLPFWIVYLMTLTLCSAEKFFKHYCSFSRFHDSLLLYPLFLGFLFIVGSTVACRCKGYLECSLDIILFISGAFKRVLPCAR